MRKEIGMMFNRDMVRAILSGQKTQTRRMIKPQPASGVRRSIFVESGIEDGHGREVKRTYNAGDLIYVRETFKLVYNIDGLVCAVKYKADDAEKNIPPEDDDIGIIQGSASKWKSAIHMPKSLARTWLEVVSLRVERLQDISENDAIREGVENNCLLSSWDNETKKFIVKDKSYCHHNCETCQVINEYTRYPFDHDSEECYSAVESYSTLWNSIYGNWEVNPWVWVTEFKKVDKVD